MPLSRAYPAGSLVFKLNQAKYYIDNTTDTSSSQFIISYRGGTPQIYADDITNLQFQYVLSTGAIVDVPPAAAMVREVIIIMNASTNGTGDEFHNQTRTRDLQTRVKVRNLGIG